MPGYASQIKKETSSYVPFVAVDPSLLFPAAATYNTCGIYVPFRHKLCRAFLSCADLDNTGTMTATLKAALAGGARAGVTVGTAISDALLAATADLVSVFEIALAHADTVERAATRYHLSLVGSNAGDIIEHPTLTLLVLPSYRHRV